MTIPPEWAGRTEDLAAFLRQVAHNIDAAGPDTPVGRDLDRAAELIELTRAVTQIEAPPPPALDNGIPRTPAEHPGPGGRGWLAIQVTQTITRDVPITVGDIEAVVAAAIGGRLEPGYVRGEVTADHIVSALARDRRARAQLEAQVDRMQGQLNSTRQRSGETVIRLEQAHSTIQARLGAVRELHRPEHPDTVAGGADWCGGYCGDDNSEYGTTYCDTSQARCIHCRVPWPCPTEQARAGTLTPAQARDATRLRPPRFNAAVTLSWQGETVAQTAIALGGTGQRAGTSAALHGLIAGHNAAVTIALHRADDGDPQAQPGACPRCGVQVTHTEFLRGPATDPDRTGPTVTHDTSRDQYTVQPCGHTWTGTEASTVRAGIETRQPTTDQT